VKYPFAGGFWEFGRPLSCGVLATWYSRILCSVADRFSAFSDGLSLKVAEVPAHLKWSKLKLYLK
jgi:hypothetical protein